MSITFVCGNKQLTGKALETILLRRESRTAWRTSIAGRYHWVYTDTKECFSTHD